MAQNRIVEMYVFDTCSLACGYCTLAESGAVLDKTQLSKFRDPEYIRSIIAFFDKHRPLGDTWNFALTGGEPLLMPNIELFASECFHRGDGISLYTNLSIQHSHRLFNFLLAHPYPKIDFIMASLHPEQEADENAFFHKAKLLREAGHHILVRFVGHPKRLTRLEQVDAKCRELDIGFYPTTLFSPNYPHAYDDRERETLKQKFTTLSQHFQLNGGLDMRHMKCHAGAKIISVNLKTGDITPCITVERPLLGNLYRDELQLLDRPMGCTEKDKLCTCDLHFQKNIVIGAEDQSNFEVVKRRYVDPIRVKEIEQSLDTMNLTFSERTAKQGRVEDDSRLSFTPNELSKRFHDLKDQGQRGIISRFANAAWRVLKRR